MMTSMILMNTSLRLSTICAVASPFSPASSTPKPRNREITMTWSIVALASGCTALEGKMDTMVSMKDCPAGAS